MPEAVIELNVLLRFLKRSRSVCSTALTDRSARGRSEPPRRAVAKRQHRNRIPAPSNKCDHNMRGSAQAAVQDKVRPDCSVSAALALPLTQRLLTCQRSTTELRLLVQEHAHGTGLTHYVGRPRMRADHARVVTHRQQLRRLCKALSVPCTSVRVRELQNTPAALRPRALRP